MHVLQGKPKWSSMFENNIIIKQLTICLIHRDLRIIDCLTARTACLVCFISTVNGRSKKRKKRSLLRAVLVAGTQQNLSSLYYFDVYGQIKNLLRVTKSLKNTNFLKCSQNSCQAKKCQNINIEVQFESSKHQPFLKP
jgi:hypothetical protein